MEVRLSLFLQEFLSKDPQDLSKEKSSVDKPQLSELLLEDP